MPFTGLEDYKARGTQATPYFALSYYTELVETEGMLLIRGEILCNLSYSEAKRLLETAQSFYLNAMRYKLVERFNKESSEFEFKDILQFFSILCIKINKKKTVSIGKREKK